LFSKGGRIVNPSLVGKVPRAKKKMDSEKRTDISKEGWKRKKRGIEKEDQVPTGTVLVRGRSLFLNRERGCKTYEHREKSPAPSEGKVRSPSKNRKRKKKEFEVGPPHTELGEERGKKRSRTGPKEPFLITSSGGKRDRGQEKWGRIKRRLERGR